MYETEANMTLRINFFKITALIGGELPQKLYESLRGLRGFLLSSEGIFFYHE